MNDMIKEVCDAAEAAAYQVALQKNEQEAVQHKWLPNPKLLAREVTDLQFGRYPKTEVVHGSWDEINEW